MSDLTRGAPSQACGSGVPLYVGGGISEIEHLGQRANHCSGAPENMQVSQARVFQLRVIMLVGAYSDANSSKCFTRRSQGMTLGARLLEVILHNAQIFQLVSPETKNNKRQLLVSTKRRATQQWATDAPSSNPSGLLTLPAVGLSRRCACCVTGSVVARSRPERSVRFLSGATGLFGWSHGVQGKPRRTPNPLSLTSDDGPTKVPALPVYQ